MKGNADLEKKRKKKRTTIHTVLDFLTNCYDYVFNNVNNSLITVDLIKAFYTVNHDILLKN